MKSKIILSILLLVLSAHAYGQRKQASRFGELELRGGGEDGLNHQLLFNGEELLQSDALSFDILNVLNGRDRDFVIVATYSGGIACPAQFNIIEIYRSGRHRMSEDFGSCSDSIKAKVVNDKVTVEMPAYAAHPDLLSKRELRRVWATKEVYTWSRGTLSKRTMLRSERAASQ